MQVGRLVSRKEVAAAIGVSYERVRQLVKKGVIVETGGLIDLDAAKAARDKQLDIAKRTTAEATKQLAGKAPKPSKPSKPASLEQPSLPLSLDYNGARTKRENMRAAHDELKYQQAVGRLVSRDEVSAKEFAVARKLRDRILGFPARLANFVPPEAMRTLTEECDALIRELQDDAARIAEATS